MRQRNAVAVRLDLFMNLEMAREFIFCGVDDHYLMDFWFNFFGSVSKT
jgi:hypothetical protein